MVIELQGHSKLPEQDAYKNEKTDILSLATFLINFIQGIGPKNEFLTLIMEYWH
jgi:hypothetical protein